jgi:hypothetical protein
MHFSMPFEFHFPSLVLHFHVLFQKNGFECSSLILTHPTHNVYFFSYLAAGTKVESPEIEG